MGLSLRGVSLALGISKNSAQNYCAGKRWQPEGQEDVEIPKPILLACAAIENGILPISYTEDSEKKRIQEMRIIKPE